MYDTDRKKINLIPNKSFRYYTTNIQILYNQYSDIIQPIITDNISTHSYIVEISMFFFKFFFHKLIVTFKNIYSCFEDV